MISALDSRVMDINAEALGVFTESLMRNAGKQVADLINDRFKGKSIRIFCGRGNNGGDGLAAANLISDQKITMIDGSEMKTPASSLMKKELKGKTLDSFTGKENDFDILVDAGLGTGLSGTLRPQWKKYVDFCNAFKGTIISIDVPTGFGTDSSVLPKITITMVDQKEGMTKENSGEIIVADIGMPKEAIRHTGPGDILRYPIPSSDSHKGDSGRLLIIAGGPYIGAAVLQQKSAFRTGTDMIYLATQKNVIPTVSVFVPETIFEEFHNEMFSLDDVSILLEVQKKCDAVLIGPGIGNSEKTQSAVKEFLSKVKIPAVIDADAISSLPDVLPKNSILTPHQGEFKKLGGNNEQDLEKISSKHNCVILLKGETDIISDGKRRSYNKTGCAAMTSAGTGDVLAGCVAGLLAKGMNSFDAAKLGAYLVGKAGESGYKKYSYGLGASDIPDYIAEELRKLLSSRGM